MRTAGRKGALRPSGAFDRLMRISTLLQAAPGGLTVKQLAQRLKVPLKVVQSDLDLMSLYGVPVETDECEEPCGPDAVWYVPKGNYIPALSLGVEEATALLRSFEGRHDPEARRVAALISSVLCRQPGEAVERRRRRVLYKGLRALYPDGEVEGRVLTLQRAAESCKVVALEYFNRQERREERVRVDPLGVVFESARGVWFLVARERVTGTLRMFNLLRLRKVEPLALTFVYPSDFDLQQHFRHAWGIEVGAAPVEVKVRFFPHFGVQEKVRKAVHGRADARLTLEDDGTLVLEDIVAGTEEFRRWLRGFGSSAEVLAPESLRQDMLAGARRMLARYTGEAAPPYRETAEAGE